MYEVFGVGVIFLGLILSAATLSAVAPNQAGSDSNDGIQENNLKLGLGWSQENSSAYRAPESGSAF